MNNNNWHVPLDRLSDEQRKVIERVYGIKCLEKYLVSNKGEVITYWVARGKEITPDEAFKILGLDRLLESEQGLQGVDWPDGIKYIVQDVVTKVISFRKQYPSVNYRILATRPKPKVKPLTDEQIEAVREFNLFLKKISFEKDVVGKFLEVRDGIKNNKG